MALCFGRLSGRSSSVDLRYWALSFTNTRSTSSIHLFAVALALSNNSSSGGPFFASRRKVGVSYMGLETIPHGMTFKALVSKCPESKTQPNHAGRCLVAPSISLKPTFS